MPMAEPRQPGGDGLGEFGEISKMMAGNDVNDRPVNFIVIVYGDIAETHSLL